MTRIMKSLFLSLGALVALAGSALAHTGVGQAHGFMHGFSHPFSGLDHMLAMVAVGLFAAQRGGRSMRLVPVSFVTMMAVGGFFGVSEMGLPMVELGIAISVIFMGAAVALEVKLPVVAAIGLVGFFAIFHGHAHGAEMPLDASGLAYASGFLTATALLHAIGITIGMAIGSLARARFGRAVQVAGGAMSVAGFGILTGYL